MTRIIGQFAQLNILPQIRTVCVGKGHEDGPVCLVEKQAQFHLVADAAMRMQMRHYRHPARQRHRADAPGNAFPEIQLWAGLKRGFSNQLAMRVGSAPLQV